MKFSYIGYIIFLLGNDQGYPKHKATVIMVVLLTCLLKTVGNVSCAGGGGAALLLAAVGLAL